MYTDVVTLLQIYGFLWGFISRDTYFIQPNIYTTVLSPSTSLNPIGVTTYNPVNNNLYVNSSRDIPGPI